jgi:hypothetical protein
MSHGRDDNPSTPSDSERLRDLEALLVMALEYPSDPEAHDRLLAVIKGRAQVRIDATRSMMKAFTGQAREEPT